MVINLESKCGEAERAHKLKLRELHESQETAVVETFQHLDERIQTVATKAMHIGDRLEAVNRQRERTIEAKSMMVYFEQFEEGTPDKVFTDRAQIHRGAELIHKLSNLASELGASTKLAQARTAIQHTYADIEQRVMEMFAEAREQRNYTAMKECAESLYAFKGYTKCMETYVNLHPFFSSTQEYQPTARGAQQLFDDIVYAV